MTFYLSNQGTHPSMQLPEGKCQPKFLHVAKLAHPWDVLTIMLIGSKVGTTPNLRLRCFSLFHFPCERKHSHPSRPSKALRLYTGAVLRKYVCATQDFPGKTCLAWSVPRPAHYRGGARHGTQSTGSKGGGISHNHNSGYKYRKSVLQGCICTPTTYLVK